MSRVADSYGACCYCLAAERVCSPRGGIRARIPAITTDTRREQRGVQFAATGGGGTQWDGRAAFTGTDDLSLRALPGAPRSRWLTKG